MRVSLVIFGVLQFLDICRFSLAWDNDELEVFDVVEEVNQNFYALLGVPQDANSTDIKKAFRRLSLQLHPDKNSAPDADEKFRHLVAVYDVLRDPGKRERYNNVLVNGLPNWRSAVYYYRHEQVLGSKLQKMQKKNRKGRMDVPDLADILEKIPTPSVWNTLPFQLPRWTFFSIVGIPSGIRAIKEVLAERRRRKKEEEEMALAQMNEEPEPEPIPRGPRRRRAGFTLQERSGSNFSEVHNYKQENYQKTHVIEKPKPTGGGLWTDDDISELIKLVKKYPGGTSDRWEKIADAMNRTVTEVTHMAKKVKDEGLKPNQVVEETPLEELPKKIKTRAEVTDSVGEWSQEQQRALEAALSKYPKGMSQDRWEKIATCVDGKSKEECQIRYRQLVELIKKKQQQ
ncbi:dnaJ homolog subfamily C member 1 isoform X2 [Neodiprion virginianus]|uniref:dnaJ homolog subfamily C member 1 isoform X2 n=1 Tax=Neodiprion fabricii TaxID=2872261 RepID=UPI001ED96925|nr:dnaJ homolog subfamily C member 1 isoform X2 [Neodiprion fabricii]XP_046465504.1 dnaJ homolog subfamily C member 1 isoform X2 [Neodiprion pinetum]XP_046603358.1 dnaJ homolog subfamily C member 1 isoform X2 [Neodiprion virginianus]